jgi:hypothetical protein
VPNSLTVSRFHTQPPAIANKMPTEPHDRRFANAVRDTPSGLN